MSEKLKQNFMIGSHYLRHEFSSRCSKSQHSFCSGVVNKKRCRDGICKCPCHEVKQ